MRHFIQPTTSRSLKTTLAIFVALAAATAGCSADENQPSDIENTPAADGGRRDGGGSTVNPDASVPMVDRSHMEVCGNGLDDDHNNLVDDGCACLSDQTQRCFPGDPALAGVGQCVWGHQACTAGSELGIWGACEGAGLPSSESCDGIDNDCNGRIDEGCACTVGETRPCYGGPPGTQDVGTCRAGTQTCMPDGADSTWGACTGDVTPAATEACDGQDHTCNGMPDEGCYCPPGQTAVFTRVPGGGASGVIAAAGDNGLFVMTCQGSSGCAPGTVQVVDPTASPSTQCVPPPPHCSAGESLDFVGGVLTCVPCEIIIQYGAIYSGRRVCARRPTLMCTGGLTPTFVFETMTWECRPTCDNGLYDQHTLDGMLICVPC